MKNLKVICLLFLVCKSTLAIGIPCDMGPSDCCTGDKTQILDTEHSDTDEESNKCCGTNCSCLCCGHVFNLETSSIDVYTMQKISDAINCPFQQRLSHKDFSNDVWQPPRVDSK